MYRWLEHTGEVELEVEAPTEEAVYADAVRALAELLGDEGHGAAVSHEVAVEAPDRARLLAELLGELAYLAETERFVPVTLERPVAQERRLRATVRGHTGDPPHLVKAVTYHRLAFDAVGGGWRARAVLDV